MPPLSAGTRGTPGAQTPDTPRQAEGFRRPLNTETSAGGGLEGGCELRQIAATLTQDGARMKRGARCGTPARLRGWCAASRSGERPGESASPVPLLPGLS